MDKPSGFPAGLAAQVIIFDTTVENRTKELLRAINADVVRLLQQGNLTFEEVSRECRCSLSPAHTIVKRNRLRRKDCKAAAQTTGKES